MKNVSSLKSNNKTESPKTPGGISKSLLTPCRRVGLSRNWRNKGPSPFVSPLTCTSEVKLDKGDDVPIKRDTRKRKAQCDDEETTNEPLYPVSINTPEDVKHTGERRPSTGNAVNLEATPPSRNIVNPRRKKSKTLLSSIIDNKDIIDVESPETSVFTQDVEIASKFQDTNKENDAREQCLNSKTAVDTPVHTKSKSKDSKIKLTIKIGGPKEIKRTENLNSNINDANMIKDDNTGEKTKDCEITENPKQKSPVNLTKECIVVIQKKLYKKDLEKLRHNEARDEIKLKKHDINPISQALFDSDSDDIPLNVMNVRKTKSKVETIDEDNDFESKVKVNKSEDKTTSLSCLKADSSKRKTKQKDILTNKNKSKNVGTKESKPSHCSLDDDDEDFFVNNRKTILIRKTYEKISKPSKAKSTGSITQKDIDELKARIEMKKKLLLAKAVTEDTEELRGLIKKWQKGCQDALMELMDLMKNKFPDKQYMDYSEMLQALKIPASLVGYDEDNDCFGTPSDENVILSKFNDI